MSVDRLGKHREIGDGSHECGANPIGAGPTPGGAGRVTDDDAARSLLRQETRALPVVAAPTVVAPA